MYFSAVLLFLIVVLMIKVSGNGKKIRRLTSEIGQLKNQIKSLQRFLSTDPAPSKSQEPEKRIEKIPEPKPVTSSSEIKKPVARPSYDPPVRNVKAGPKKSVKKSQWSELKVKMAENWTGVIGSLALVAGVVFLGGYAALLVKPIFKFFIVLGFASVLFLISYKLRSKKQWGGLGNWIGSAGVAIYFFGCFSSIAIPGMQWIFNPTGAISLLVSGILTSVAFGYISGDEKFVSLHVALSLFVLSLIPPSKLTLIIGTLTILSSFSFIFKHKWDLQHLLGCLSFFIFHTYWWSEIHRPSINPDLRIVGIICVLLVGLFGVVTHYRKLYSQNKFSDLPFFSHAINWMTLGIGLALYSTGSKVTPALILGSGVLAYALSLRAKNLGIKWLYVTDNIVGQILFLFGLVLFTRYGVDKLTLNCIMVLFTFVFIYISSLESEKLVGSISKGISYLVQTGLVIHAIDALRGTPTKSSEVRTIASVFIVMVLGLIFRTFLLKDRDESYDGFSYQSLSSKSKNYICIPFIFSGVFAATIVGACLLSVHFDYLWETALFVLIATITFFKVKIRFQALYFCIHILTFLGVLCFTYQVLISREFFSLTLGQSILKTISLLLTVTVGFLFSENFVTKKKITYPYVYMYGMLVILASYAFLNPLSNLVPGVLWIVCSLICFELGKFLLPRVDKNRGDTGRFVIHLGFIFLILFCGRHILVHMQVQDYLGPIRIRFLIELLAIGVVTYIASMGWKGLESRSKLILKAAPLILELLLLLIVFTFALEFEQIYHPIFWTIIAIALFFISKKVSAEFNRLKWYSVVFYWWSIIHITAVTSTIHVPSSSFWLQGWFIGLVLLIVLGVYIWCLAGKNILAGIEVPAVLKIQGKLIKTVNKKEIFWFFIPYFVGIAIFLYWRFDKLYLTLFWVAEIFIIFIFGIYKKEKFFSTSALALLGICLLRLVFYDLKETGTLARGLVFIGVGAIMLLMNSFQRKYKGRFK